MKKLTLFSFFILLFIFSACSEIVKITNFDECVAAGNPIMESYPRQCNVEGEIFVEEFNLQRECLNNNGKWIDEFNECEFISKDKCEFLGGTFNECGSACRNNPEVEMCTMQCIPYCSFK